MTLVMPPDPTDDELKEWSGKERRMSEPNKAVFSMIGEQVASLFGYDKCIQALEDKNKFLREVAETQFMPRIAALEQLCRDMYKECLRGCGGCQYYDPKMGTCNIEIQQRIASLGLIEGASNNDK